MPRNNEIRSFNILSDGEDHHLIHRYQQTGDPQAFRVLIDRHLPALRRLLFTLLNGCREDMENAEQETLLAVARGLPGFRFKSSFSTWLYRIGRNQALDRLRRRRRRERRLERAGGGRAPDGREAVSTAPQPAPASVDPEAELLRRECAGGLLKAFQALSPPKRVLILLRDLEGQTIREIAGVLGWPARTVKSRLHRVQEKLAGRLQGNAAMKPDPICRWARTTLQEIRDREAGNPAILDYDLMRHLSRCPWCRGFQKFLHHFGPQLRREVERRSEPPAGSASILSAERIAGLLDAPRPGSGVAVRGRWPRRHPALRRRQTIPGAVLYGAAAGLVFLALIFLTESRPIGRWLSRETIRRHVELLVDRIYDRPLMEEVERDLAGSSPGDSEWLEQIAGEYLPAPVPAGAERGR